MTKMDRPWGFYEVLHKDEHYQVKRIYINPGQRLSYQKHEKRAEKWTIVEGEGLVTLNDESFNVGPGAVVAVRVGDKHRIHNIGKDMLMFIEVQLGEYFGEDDIVRFEDDYERN